VAHETGDDGSALAFVRAAIGSLCALELLILLRRDRRRVYRSDQLVRELRSSQLAVAQAIDNLTKLGLVEEVPDAGYRYREGPPHLEAICEQVESDYARRPVTVIRAIMEAPDEKLRILADAFRLSEKNK
jgi:biotin operon repressor